MMAGLVVMLLVILFLKWLSSIQELLHDGWALPELAYLF